LGLKQLQKQRV